MEGKIPGVHSDPDILAGTPVSAEPFRPEDQHRHHAGPSNDIDDLRSYSVDAAHALRDAVSRVGGALYEGDCALPYEVFFDCVPGAHLRFFESLRAYYQSADCVCTHGGLDPGIPRVQEQTRHA